MDRRRFFQQAALRPLAAALSNVSGCRFTRSGPPPNVVLIISDDQAWGDYGFMGHPSIRTPRLDRLASESLVFTRGWVAAPLCCPSLASIITGLHPHQHGITSNDPPAGNESRSYRIADWPAERLALRRRMEQFHREAHTLPRLLAERGYLSFQSGKWWGGHYSNGGFTHGMTHGDPARGGRHGDEGLIIGRDTMQPVYNFIDEAGRTPFFLWFAPFLPHTPHTPPERLLSAYQDKTDSIHVARYWAMCEWWDEACGKLLDYLEGRSLAENTLVVYLADNGWIQREDGSGFADRSKRSPYEGGLRTPLMLRWPGRVSPARDEQTPVSSVDIAPSVLAACDVEAPRELPGIDLLDSKARTRQAVFASAYTHDAVDLDQPISSLRHLCVTEKEWKLIFPGPQNPGRVTAELYDLKNDPHETVNLADRHPEKVSHLQSLLQAWWPEGQSQLAAGRGASEA